MPVPGCTTTTVSVFGRTFILLRNLCALGCAKDAARSRKWQSSVQLYMAAKAKEAAKEEATKEANKRALYL